MHNNHDIPSSWGWESTDYWEDEIEREGKEKEEGIISLNRIEKKEGEGKSLPFSIPTPCPKDNVLSSYPLPFPPTHPDPSLHQGDYEEPF